MLNTQQPDIGCRNNPALMGYISPMMTNDVGMFSSPPWGEGTQAF